MPHFNFMTYTGHRFYKIKKLYGSADGYILIFDSDFPTDTGGYPLGLSEMEPYLPYLMETVGFFSQNANAGEYFTGKPGSILYWNVSVERDARISIHPVFTDPLTKHIYDLDFSRNTGYDPQSACTYPFLIAVKYNNHYYPFIQADGYELYSIATDWKYGLWYYADIAKKPSHTSYGSVTGVKIGYPKQNMHTHNAYSDGWDAFYTYIEGNYNPLDRDDPDPNIDDSDGDHGRTPTDDIGGDTIGDDDLPTLSVMDTGLVTLYNPTVGQLQALGHFLWSDAFSVDTFKKLFADPFDTLLGLSILPVTPKVSGSHNIYFGNIDSGVSCNVVANQFLKVDMGSLTLNETYASAFDYAPSTQVDIYLPFIGSHGLNTNDVMGSTLHLIYKFDLLSGGCIAELFINHTSQGNKGKGMKYNRNMGLAYTFSGQCSCSIPLTSNNYNGMIQGLIQSIGTIGGIGASVATGNPALGIASVATSATTIGLQANTPTVQRSGNIGSSNALLSCLTPYLSVQRAHVCKPGHFYSKRGIPSQVYVGNISSVGTGNYFQIADCADLHASGASDTELSEIKSILTSGAIW